LRVDKVVAINTVCSFFGPPCIYDRYRESDLDDMEEKMDTITFMD